jgi:hypothetical protein
VQQVQKELIGPMNTKFEAVVFQLKVRTDKKYLKIHCLPGCPFDIWLKYTLDNEGAVTNMRVFRFII